jgi:multidrug resistance efflux pump
MGCGTSKHRGRGRRGSAVAPRTGPTPAALAAAEAALATAQRHHTEAVARDDEAALDAALAELQEAEAYLARTRMERGPLVQIPASCKAATMVAL